MTQKVMYQRKVSVPLHAWRGRRVQNFDSSPYDHQAAHLSREQVNLIGPLSDGTKQTLDSICCPNVAVHRLRKIVKGQGLLFLLG